MSFNGLKIWLAVSIFSVIAVAATPSADLRGDLRLLTAVKNQDREAVRALLKDHVNVNASQADGATALDWAADRNDLETLDLLIRNGANVNTANVYGVTPLSLACTNRNAPMV